MTDARYSVGDDYIFKAAAISECTISDTCYIVGKCYALKAPATGKNTINLFYMVGDGYAFKISATAERDGTKLIAVVMGAQTRDERNSIARSLLDLGFSNYTLYREDECVVDNVPVHGANVLSLPVYSESLSMLINKNHKNKVEKIYEIKDALDAPIESGKP